MPYKDKKQQKKYQREWVQKRRIKWFKENGPCLFCGSEEHLELHHVDPKTKISHKIFSWSKTKRLLELAKCIILCKKCHKKETKKLYADVAQW